MHSSPGWSAWAPGRGWAGALFGFLLFAPVALHAQARGANREPRAASAPADASGAPSPVVTARPDPAGWFAGDVHVHRSCGGSPVSVSVIYNAMVTRDLEVVSLLADMGNGEVLDPVVDLPKVTGVNDPISTATRIIRWDAEWHWDAIYTQFPHQALGGHLLALGLGEAHQIWEEYTYPILDWAHQQGGIAGFAHFQYLDDGIPQSLTCCTPIEYPVEVALGAADFISEDVDGSDTAIHAYYRLLNCGFRTGFAAGSDYPCGAQVGDLITYAQIPGGTLSYEGWIGAIAAGRTVVSRDARRQFLDLRVNGAARPGDEIPLAGPGDVQVSARWTSTASRTRTLELVKDGEVIASESATAGPGGADSLTATVHFEKSGWLCARVMGSAGHDVHTGAVFVVVNDAPVRTSVADAEFYVQWLDTLLDRTSPGGAWDEFFEVDRAAAQARYAAAREVYRQIAEEAGGGGGPGPDSLVTLFPPGAAPVNANVSDGQPIEVGVRFRASEPGRVVALRYYKGSSNSGLHLGHLWTQSGSLLAEATYTGESGSGWQQVALAPPVEIAANTSYVASVHSTGTYAETVNGLASAVVNGPLRALADGEDGPNGVYAYGTGAVFPTASWSSTNYWVDVLFEPASAVAPAADSLWPAPGAVHVAMAVAPAAVFDADLDPSTLTEATFTLTGPGGAPVAGVVAYEPALRCARLTPLAPLSDSTTYTARLRGGGTDPRIKDAAGHPLAADVTWSFTTMDASLVSAGGPTLGVPRLVVRPNPSRGSLSLAADVPSSGVEGLEIVGVSGRVLRRLAHPPVGSTRVNALWDGLDDHGGPVPPGLYFARLRTPSGSIVARFAMIR
jgi:hypothetical protein